MNFKWLYVWQVTLLYFDPLGRCTVTAGNDFLQMFTVSWPSGSLMTPALHLVNPLRKCQD